MHSHVIATKGRGACPSGAVFIGHGSRWQNPFEDYGEDALEAFRDWFYGDSYSAQRFRDAVRKKLAHRMLACDCGDCEHCHAEVIVQYLSRYGDLDESVLTAGSRH